MMSYKRWGKGFLILALLMMSAAGMLTVIVDPYFHFHAPLDSLEYQLNNERYQNDGIVRHFEYDAIITGTSMTENFKTSELDKLFDVHSIKVPFAGGSYKEINENLKRAVEENPNIRLIVRSLDGYGLKDDKDHMRYDPEYYPTYLYDDVLYNDVKYILNKTTLINNTCKQTILFSMEGGRTTTFDEYCSWADAFTYGREALDKSYHRKEKTDETLEMTDKDYKTIEESLEQNVISLVEANPDIEFYLFFPPFSIYYYDWLNQDGELERYLERERAAAEILLEYENLHFFAFDDEFDMICDLDNYKDFSHYGEWINSQILLWMNAGEHQLTKENYEEYFEKIHEFYTTYDYDTLFVSSK